MANGLVIKLDSVDYRKSKNRLVFKAYIPQKDINQLFKIEFCGTELDSNTYLSDDQKVKLREILSERFGFPPYNDLEKIRNKLDEERYFRIKLV